MDPILFLIFLSLNNFIFNFILNFILVVGDERLRLTVTTFPAAKGS
jgi:hypothetical protein